MTPDGLPHSDTAGSSFASNSPTLFAGSRVLPRRLVPRHPPRTLTSLSRLRPLFKPRSARRQSTLSLQEDPDRLDEIYSNFLTYSVDNVLTVSALIGLKSGRDRAETLGLFYASFDDVHS